MPGKPAVVLTAAALSVTVGVLIGIVLIIGNKARQTSATPTSISVAATTGLRSDVPAIDPAEMSISEAPPITSSATNSAASTSAPATTPRAIKATTSSRPTPRPPTPPRTTTSRPSIVFTTVTLAPPTSSTARSTIANTPTPTASRPPATLVSFTPAPTTTAVAVPAAVGSVAGRPCAHLGDKATAPGGDTVFCQRNFSNGSLAWRAVVQGGGCLSKKLTGIGIDGRAYVCRPDKKGLNHWKRA